MRRGCGTRRFLFKIQDNFPRNDIKCSYEFGGIRKNLEKHLCVVLFQARGCLCPEILMKEDRKEGVRLVLICMSGIQGGRRVSRIRHIGDNR